MLNRSLQAFILAQQDAIAEAALELQYARQPLLRDQYSPLDHQKALRDLRYHCAYLAEAVAVARPALFADYIGWAGPLLSSYHVPLTVLQVTLEALQEVLGTMSGPAEWAILEPYLVAGRQALEQALEPPQPFIQPEAPYQELARQYLEALLAGNRHGAITLALQAVEGGMPIQDLYLHVFQPAQYELGRLWQTNQISVAQEHYGTAVTQMVMSLLYPRIFATERCHHRLVATCIGGELHEIGVRMVADFFEMAGWDTFYLGANTPVESIVATVRDRQAEVLAVSVTMTLHLSRLVDLVAALRQAELGPVKILVGGYPFNQVPDLWREVGADGYAPDAQAAIALAHEWVGGCA